MTGNEMTEKEYYEHGLRLKGRKEELLHWLELYDNVISVLTNDDKKIYVILRELVLERLDRVEGEIAVDMGTTRSRFFMEEEE